MLKLRLLLLFPLLLSTALAEEPMDDTYRRSKQREMGWDAWPPPLSAFKPPTAPWANSLLKRLHQVSAIPTNQQRWDGFISTVSASFISPSYTALGFAVIKGPEKLWRELNQTLHTKMHNGELKIEEVREGAIQVIEGPNRPLFAAQPEMNRRILEELRPLHENWSGIDLVGSTAYGLRVYPNQSSLLMHVDKLETHVISSIFHIDHDGPDWPLVIEGFDGNVHSVVLKPGELLFYESSKCLHGRPTVFGGTFYSSIFTHYRPKYDWHFTSDHSKYAVPSFYHKHNGAGDRVDYATGEITKSGEERNKLEMRGTGFREICEGGVERSWCDLGTKWVRGGGGGDDEL